MLIEMLQGKIHRGVVTDVRIDYMGSLTVDPELIAACGLREFQKIQLLNITNGARLETYLINGVPGRREIVVNGAAARLAMTGDRVIVAGFGHYDPAELKTHKPRVVVLDERNQVIETH
jgi:aspartate 1-decarboxylase